MASYEQRGNTVRATVSLGRGKKVRQSFDTQAEAERWAAAQERKKATGGALSSRLLRDLFEVYLDRVGSRTDTAKWNGYRLLKFCTQPWTAKRLTDVTPDDINQWAQERKTEVAEATVAREMALVSAAFTYGVKSLKWIKENPCFAAEKLRAHIPRDRAVLSNDELAALKAAGGVGENWELGTETARAVACFFLARQTGMRSGEILRLKPEHWFKARRVVRVAAEEAGGRKGSRSGRVVAGRDVPLTAEAESILQALLDGRAPKQPYIVGMSDGLRDALWRKAVVKAGVDNLHFHDSKHEACTMLSKHVDVIALSHIVGTKDIRLLRDTYYQSDADKVARLLPKQLTA